MRQLSEEMTGNPLLKNVQKIAVLRANALGDFIVTLPAIHALHAAFPTAEIVLLGKPWHQEFLVKGRTPISRVIVVPVKQGIRNEPGMNEDEHEISAFINRMRQERFDLIINFQGSGITANPFIKSFGATYTAGLISEGAEPLDFNLDYYYYQSEVLRYLELVKMIGASGVSLEPSLNVLEKDEQEVQTFIDTLNNKRFVVLHPIAMDVRRMWPIENYVPLAEALKQRNIEVVFTGSKEDRAKVDGLLAQMSMPAINACGYFSLGGLAAVIKKAALVIAADTGPLHLARALDAPTVGMYWAPNLITWGPLTRQHHRPVVSWNMHCPHCGIIPNDPYPFEPRNECEHMVSFVRDITPEQVLEAADSLLKQTAKEAHTTNEAFIKA